MPLCVECGSPLTCGNTHQHPLITPCSLRDGALWVHVMDDAGESVSDVPVEVSGKGRKDTIDGFARFDPMAPQAYVVTLPALEDALAERYQRDDLFEGGVRPAQGEVAYVGFKLLRRPEVTVKVVQSGNHARLFDAARVTLSGTEAAGPDDTANGIAAMGRRSRGLYTATVELAEADRQDFFTTPKDANVPPGAAYEILVEAELKNVVSVVLSPGEQDLRFLPGEGAAPVRLRVTIEQTRPDIGFRGTVRLTCTGDVAVHEDEQCTAGVEELQFDTQQGSSEGDLWIPGDRAADGRVEAELEDPEDPKVRVTEMRAATVRLRPVNVATVSIEPADLHAYFHPVDDADATVELTVKVTQTVPEIGFSGEVDIATAGGVVAYLDDGAAQVAHELAFSGNLAEETKSLWVKKSAAANGGVTASLRQGRTAEFVPSEPAQAVVVIEEINVITATITGDELVLVNANHGVLATTRSQITIDVVETQPLQPCGDLVVTITYGAELTCHGNAGVVASGTAIPAAQLPMNLDVEGLTQGDSPITVTAGGTPGAAYAFAPAASLDMRVEALVIDAYQFRDGESVVDPNFLVTRVGAPGPRELHAQDVGGTFTHARLVVAAPSARFWAKASHLTVTPHGAIQVYSDAGALAVAAALQQGNFAGVAELERWVKTTGAPPGLDPQAPAPGIPLAIPVLKPLTRCHVACGATTIANPKTLHNGSVMELDTFGFDQHLDRVTRADCRTFLLNNPGNNARQQAAATSRAAGHHHYDLMSAAWTNRNFPNAGGALFTNFIAAMTPIGGGVGPRSVAGMTYIRNHLLNVHGIVLHNSTEALITAYLLVRLNAGGAHLGFNGNYGVPGVHAEVLSVNAMFNAGVPQAEITVATYKVQNGGQAHGKRFIACPNCSGILMAAVRVITG
ncbi:MAG: hypothetical protein U0414_23405 [Polyangiaceae bacterium]